jgi:hypothetical protein
MNCHEARRLLLAEDPPSGRPSAAAAGDRPKLVVHLEECPGCARLQSDLAAARSHWQTHTKLAALPDVEEEWRAIRRQLTSPGEGRPGAARRMLGWMALPVAGAALATLALVLVLRSVVTVEPTSPMVLASQWAPAEALFVEVPDSDASPVVFVDEESGWLVVWAVNGPFAGGI